MPPDGASATVAYQRVRLEEIRDLYQELDLDLDHYLNVELGVSKRLDSAEEDASAIREMFSSLGVDLDNVEPDGDSSSAAAPQTPRGKKYRRIELGNAEDFRGLAEEAEAYLAKVGVNLEKDPLLQVMGSTEAAGTVAAYREKYGDISWDKSDYLIVGFAGFVATLLDIFLVRIPADTSFLGNMQQGSPLTKWLKERSEVVHERFLERFENKAKVPYDDVRHPEVPGMRPKTHRSQSFGHDPILGFIFGVMDILGNTGTYIDKYGDIIRVDKAPADPVSLTAAFLKVFFHLLSDVCTSAGIQPPFFTLLQLIKTESPFVLGPSGERVSWTDVARYMYVHGYDLRHFATMGIVPATVEMVIRGWRLCESYEKEESPELTKAKTASMLMLGHTIAVSGNLVKTGAIYGMNPLALNWAQALWMFPVTVSWLRESVKRDQRIRAKLDAEWASIYLTDSTSPSN
jgi:hypothetical protein